MIHSFVSYDIPIATTAGKISTATSAASVVGADATASASTGPAFLDNLKQLVLGVASKASAVTDGASAGAGQSTSEIVYTDKVVPCITTTGQTFGIWLNVLYLAPLTYLFVSFFIASYIKRSGAESARKGKSPHASHVAVAEKAGWEAAQNLQQEVYGTPENVNKSSNGAGANLKGNGSPNGRVLKSVTNQRHSRYA